MTEQEIRNAVKRYIEDHGIKLTHIAQRCGMSKQRLHRIIHSDQKISLTDYLRICEALQVPYSYFIVEVEPKCITT